MRNTEFDMNSLSSFISTDSFAALKSMIDDLGLEIEDVSSC